MPDSFLTVAEVAELLKLNPQTVRNWIDRGELPAVRLGQRRVRIRQSDLDRLLEKGYTAEENSESGVADQTGSGGDDIEALRNGFATLLADSIRVVGAGSQDDLVQGIRELAERARALADAVEH